LFLALDTNAKGVPDDLKNLPNAIAYLHNALADASQKKLARENHICQHRNLIHHFHENHPP
jgi:hypothetical protein